MNLAYIEALGSHRPARGALERKSGWLLTVK